MIFRKVNPATKGDINPLHRICARIKHDNALQTSILDASEDDGALVVFCAAESMTKIVKLALQNHWPGNIEVFCLSSLVTGANKAKDSASQHYRNMDKSLRYLN